MLAVGGRVRALLVRFLAFWVARVTVVVPDSELASWVVDGLRMADETDVKSAWSRP